MMPEEIIVTFFTTHHALRAERVAREENISCTLIPTPRTISADCTIALTMAPNDTAHARTVFAARNIETQEWLSINTSLHHHIKKTT